MSDPILYDLSWTAWKARQEEALRADLLEPSVPLGDPEQEADARWQWRRAMDEGEDWRPQEFRPVRCEDGRLIVREVERPIWTLPYLRAWWRECGDRLVLDAAEWWLLRPWAVLLAAFVGTLVALAWVMWLAIGGGG